MTSQLCVVTGATSGIGFEIARGLGREGHHVVVVGRNSQKLEALEVPGASKITRVLGDLGTVAGARQIARRLAQLGPLDVMIHCAGLLPSRCVVTSEGFEEAFTVNHLAPAAMNQLIRAKRIVQVSGGLYVLGHVDLEADPVGASFHVVKTYATTKLWNLMATVELAKTLPSDVSLSAVHPGVIRTALGDRTGFLGALLRVVKLMWKSPQRGAVAPLALALKPEFASLRGEYFDELEQKPLAGEAVNAELRAQVVSKTMRLLEGVK